MAALAGAAGGAAAGGLTGALIGMGSPEYEAKRYEGKVKAGNILLSIHTEDSTERERAKKILENLARKIEQLTRDEAMKAAGYLAAVLGKAHARQMDTTAKKKWQEVLRRHRPRKRDAPSGSGQASSSCRFFTRRNTLSIAGSMNGSHSVLNDRGVAEAAAHRTRVEN